MAFTACFWLGQGERYPVFLKILFLITNRVKNSIFGWLPWLPLVAKGSNRKNLIGSYGQFHDIYSRFVANKTGSLTLFIIVRLPTSTIICIVWCHGYYRLLWLPWSWGLNGRYLFHGIHCCRQHKAYESFWGRQLQHQTCFTLTKVCILKFEQISMKN